MTPQQAIKLEIFRRLQPKNDVDDQIPGYTWPQNVDAETIDAAWEALDATSDGSCWLHEAMSDVRCSGTPTGLPTQSSRHYECKEVAAYLGGRWVGWTYWYGGGKHAEPESVDWVGEAYFLEVEEDRRVVLVRTFIRRDRNHYSPPLMLLPETEPVTDALCVCCGKPARNWTPSGYSCDDCMSTEGGATC